MESRPIALVTGARRGIGRSAALALAEAGFDLAVTDAAASVELDAVCTAIRERGARAVPLASDLAAIDTHDALLDAVEAELGAPRCLVNNAGVSVLARGDLLDVTPESYDRCAAVNTRGTFFLMQAFGRRLVARAGNPAEAAGPGAVPATIVTISSSNAVAASVQRGEYCVSKAGLSMATTLFSLRLAEYGVGVYEIQPGLIATEMTAPSAARYDALMAAGGTAIRRWGTPDEVARVIRSCATGGLPYSAGQAIRVDGGLLVQKF
ncbi:3-ketoacyl-ACP reductase [Burkholderia perseverans]|uniref:3-ketoacyl-ACP reductase n=1 Tax=Burkholderia perseverans TaxID=2615214 RepID=UPI001FEFBBB9|nr:3-ketoacyl-ACP reductase [Burkholderia perseverans]